MQFFKAVAKHDFFEPILTEIFYWLMFCLKMQVTYKKTENNF